MSTRKTLTVWLAVGAAAFPAAAQLDWNSIDAGGGVSSGGGFALAGAIGQPDAAAATGGDFALHGGYLAGAAGGDDCPGDIDQNGSVDLEDLLSVLGTFGLCQDEVGFDPAIDIDGSGCIDLPDLLTVLGAFDTAC